MFCTSSAIWHFIQVVTSHLFIKHFIAHVKTVSVSLSLSISAIQQLTSVFMFLLASILDRLNRSNEPEKSTLPKV